MQGSTLKPTIDKDSCLGCGICAENCPFNAIHIDSKAEIDLARCRACGNCARVCPQDAIVLVTTQSPKVISNGKRLQSLRKRAEKLGKGLNKIEQELRELNEASPS